MNYYRTVWISDVHLGTRDAKTAFLLSFLRQIKTRKLFIVGDLIDGWQFKQGKYWTESHNAILQELLQIANASTEVIYIPGNHDEFIRRFTSVRLRNIKIAYDAVHRTADGKQLLILHGDEFDVEVRYAKWLTLLGSLAHEVGLMLDRLIYRFRRRFGYPYWSLSGYMKQTSRQANRYFEDYRSAALNEAKQHRFDGVICGHIHHAECTEIEGMIYANDGDWVDSCTAIVETWSGRLSLVEWLQESRQEVEEPEPVLDAIPQPVSSY